MVIDWVEWGEGAFARARALGKPLLLSLAARWCHACRRMDEETWEDPGVAAAVERATVPVRVDADARPDIYGRYHLGGLPTTALLTPDGEFVRGGTFLSPSQFFAFLETALADFRSGRLPAPRAPLSAAPTGNLVGEVIARLVRRIDPEHGGFGVAPKQPEVQALRLLLRRWRSSRDVTIERAVRLALDAIVAHLSDPRDGGFFRYAAAEDWSGPHTEKVALDQAQLAALLLEAGSALGARRHIESALDTLAHASRRLADESGRVFASVAADPAYYAGAQAPDDPPAVDQRRFADSGAAMVGAGWLAFALTGEPPPFQPEFRLAAPGGCVPHRLDERDGITGLLSDQALAVAATLMEYRLSGAPRLLDWAVLAADWSVEHLWDEAAGAFRATPAAPGDAVMLPPIHPLVANGEMALALIDLAAHAGRAEYERYAERLIGALGRQARVSPAGPAVALVAQRMEDKAAEADLEGEAGDARTARLARAVVAAIGPTVTVRWRGGARPRLTLCVRDLCLPVIEEPQELGRSLIDLDLAPSGILAFTRAWS